MRSLRAKLVLGAFLASLIACAPADSGSVVSVAIDGGDRSLVVGQAVALTAAVVTTGGASDAVEWASSEPAVASVDATGVVSALAVGTTDVTARSASDATKSDTIVVTVTPAGALVWTRQFGTDAYDDGAGVAIDADGHVYVAGTTAGDLEGMNLGTNDAFVRSYDGDGAVRWTRQFGTDTFDDAVGMASAASGHLYVAGSTSGDLEGASAGATDAYVRSYDADGDVRWTRQFGTAAEDSASDVATDAAGRVYVVGETSGDLEGTSAGSADGFVRSYDEDGTLRWTRQFGTAFVDQPEGVAVDADGNVYVGGRTYGVLEGAGAGDVDVFVRSYDADGDVRWTRQFGTASSDRLSAVAVDGSGNVYVVGHTAGDLEGTNAGGLDAFVRSYDRDGAVRWTRQFGSEETDIAHGVTVDADDRVFVTGFVTGSVDGPAAGFQDAFVRSYDVDGGLLSGRQFGTSSADFGGGIAAAADGSVYVVGHTYGALVGVSEGDADAFVRKYGP